MNYHPLVRKIKTILIEHNFWCEEFEHEAVRTSIEASKVRTGYTVSQGAKALIVIIKVKNETKFIMLVIPGDKRFDKKKVQQLTNAKDIRFATEEEVTKITGGVKIGGVPPLGNLFNLPVIADPSLFENEKIIFNAGDRSYSIAMKSGDYKSLVNPQIFSIT